MKFAQCFLVAMLSAMSVDAHNWLSSPARGNGGGLAAQGFNGFTSPPCPQKTSRVHTQVGPGQVFPVEWASGHGFGSYTYLVLIAGKDESHLQKHTFELLDQYLNEAPPEAHGYMPEYKTGHVTSNGPRNFPSLDQDITADYGGIMPGGRPVIFRQFGPGASIVYSKKASFTNGDVRVKYTNPKFPWIISAHKFALHEDTADEMDFNFMEIPPEYPSGKYVVQYLWKGYYDCVDVNYLTQPATDMWGAASGGGVFDKVDHCHYTPSLAGYQAGPFCTVLTADGGGIDECKAACESAGANCDLVQVQPKILSAPANAAFDQMLPAVAATCSNPNNVPDAQAQVCYTVKAGATPKVGPAYKVVSDPEDPVFYATCFVKADSWAFADRCEGCLPTSAAKGFRFGLDSCISCRDMDRFKNPLTVPDWKFTDKCEHCDVALG